MIKLLKIQKGIWIIVIGVLAMVIYSILIVKENPYSEYVLGLAGALFIIGSLLLLYPILTAKKDKDGIVHLDPNAEELQELDAPNAEDKSTLDDIKKP